MPLASTSSALSPVDILQHVVGSHWGNVSVARSCVAKLLAGGRSRADLSICGIGARGTSLTNCPFAAFVGRPRPQLSQLIHSVCDGRSMDMTDR